MMPELGSFLLCPALAIALLLSIYPQWGAARQDSRMMAVARPLTYGMFAAIALAFLCPVHAFVVNDFTVAYVPPTPIPNCRCITASPPPGRMKVRCCCGCCC